MSLSCRARLSQGFESTHARSLSSSSLTANFSMEVLSTSLTKVSLSLFQRSHTVLLRICAIVDDAMKEAFHITPLRHLARRCITPVCYYSRGCVLLVQIIIICYRSNLTHAMRSIYEIRSTKYEILDLAS